MPRCPRCGLDEDGRGVMCISADASPLTVRFVLWSVAALALFVLVLLAVAAR